jgi:predicted nuclease of predicted toxin-antitoxin system
MKPALLANENVPLPSVTYLRGLGYDVAAVAEAGAGIRDREVLQKAAAEQRWVVTFDRDYGELVFARRGPLPPAVLYMRLRSYRPDQPGRILASLLAEPAAFAGHFVVVEDGGLRKRPLPVREQT